MEAFEQQFMQQQNRANQIFGGGAGGARQRFRKEIDLTKNFVKQLIFFSFSEMPAAQAPEPSESNITLLVDMGFPRQQAIEALREAHNDLSTATAILLRNT